MVIQSRIGLAVALMIGGCTSPAPSGSSASATSSSFAAPSSIGPPSAVASSGHLEAPPVASASASVAPGKAMPPLSDLKQLTLRQKQPEAASKLCEGTKVQLTIDLTAWKWIYGVCGANEDDPPNASSLKAKNGAFTPEQRTDVEVSFAKLRHSSATTCSPNGTISLSLTKKDESALGFVDSAACGGAPIEIAEPLDWFLARLTKMVDPPPP